MLGLELTELITNTIEALKPVTVEIGLQRMQNLSADDADSADEEDTGKEEKGDTQIHIDDFILVLQLIFYIALVLLFNL